MLQWLFGKKKQQPSKQQQKKKSKKQSEAQDKWMYDFMIQFLTSPIWRVSILDFVDNKCIIFDNEQENKFEYTTIHNQFKQLVGNLVDGMMSEIGLDEEKLAELLQKGFQSKERKLFNQFLLADDFLRFKQMMVKRNKSLQQQALNAIQNPSTQTPVNSKASKLEQQRQALKQSKRLQQQRQQKLQQEQQQMIRKVMQLSRLEQQQSRIKRQSSESQALHALEQKINEKQKQQRVQKQDKTQSKTQQTDPIETSQKARHQRPRRSKLQSLKGSVKQSPLGQLPPLKGLSQRVQVDEPVKIQEKLEKIQQNLSNCLFLYKNNKRCNKENKDYWHKEKKLESKKRSKGDNKQKNNKEILQ